MGGLSIWHWAIVLAIVLLIFGTRRLRNIGSDLGGAVKGFKEGLNGTRASRGDEELARVSLSRGAETTARD